MEFAMDIKSEQECEITCVFEESLEIDFEYEFDAAKFFDFTHFETPDDVAQSEMWFDFAAGYPHSHYTADSDMEVDDLVGSTTSSPRYGSEKVYATGNVSGVSEVSSTYQGRKVPKMLRSISMPTSQLNSPVSSRLLQPTASLLAKKNHQIGAHSRTVPRRFQKPGTPVNLPGHIDATKRQKLEIGYLRKVAQLKHQTSFTHKSAKKAGTAKVNSNHAKAKVTVPKEPDLATAHRALRQRSNLAPQHSSDAKYNRSSFRERPFYEKIQEAQISIQAKNKTTTSLPQSQNKNVCGGKTANGSGECEPKRSNSLKASAQQKIDQIGSFRARELNNKMLSSKGDIGVSGNCKRETTIPREFKLSNSKKLSQNPPTELFAKLSLIPGNHNTLLLGKHRLPLKALNKHVSFSDMKENKNNAISEKSMKCCGNGRRMATYIKKYLTRVR